MSKLRQRRLINLQTLVSDAEQGYFEGLHDIEEYFKELTELLDETKTDVLKAHIKSIECSHESFKKPVYKHVKMVLGYIYVFEKVCDSCGHKEVNRVEDFNGVDYPVGFEGATEQFYNNCI